MYRDISEVIHEALRLLMDYERRKDQLKQEVALGFAQLNDGHFCAVADEEDWLSIARNGR
jgi:Arc/MetJ-type ribon-helix-helix transcriptional regulator